MKENPLVSVIISTYKRPPNMVVRALKSVLQQSYKNIEIIVVDDSPDDYPLRENVRKEVLDISDNRVKYYQHETNKGACAARNTAIKHSKGKFLIYLDDDDEFTSDCIEKKLSKFTDNSIGLVYSKRYICINDDYSNMKVPDQKMISGNIFRYVIARNIIGAFPMFRKICIEECGLFNEELLSAQDYEMWLRILSKFKANYVNEPLAIVHWHDSERIGTNPQKGIQGVSYVINQYKKYYYCHPFAHHYKRYELSVRYYSGKMYLKAWLNGLYSFILNPFDVITNLRLINLLLIHAKK